MSYGKNDFAVLSPPPPPPRKKKKVLQKIFKNFEKFRKLGEKNADTNDVSTGSNLTFVNNI